MAMSLWECRPTPCRLCGEEMYIGYEVCIYCGWDQSKDPSEYPEIYQQDIYEGEYDKEDGFPYGMLSYYY